MKARSTYPSAQSQVAFARVATALAFTSVGALAVGMVAVGRMAVKALAIQEGAGGSPAVTAAGGCRSTTTSPAGGTSTS